MKEVLTEITGDVLDIRTKSFQYTKATLVPSRHDPTLTFERGASKVGKEIETCVLYVDIRNSVALNVQHHTQTMGRIYTAFSKSMLKIAKHHNGRVRNIIGDRVMIVFPSQNCFLNAIQCAISINHISERIIKGIFKEVDFRCGIGIDYGPLKVVKVGLHRLGSEGFDNKNLVWVGHPANIASRLTDVANKTIDHSGIKVNYYPYNPPFFISHAPLFGVQIEKSNEMYQRSPKEVILTNEEFAKKLSFSDVLGTSYCDGKLIRFDKIGGNTAYPAIMMTGAVYNGLKSASPTNEIIVKNFFTKIDNHKIKDIKCDVYGGVAHWKI